MCLSTCADTVPFHFPAVFCLTLRSTLRLLWGAPPPPVTLTPVTPVLTDTYFGGSLQVAYARLPPLCPRIHDTFGHQVLPTRALNVDPRLHSASVTPFLCSSRHLHPGHTLTTVLADPRALLACRPGWPHFYPPPSLPSPPSPPPPPPSN